MYCQLLGWSNTHGNAARFSASALTPPIAIAGQSIDDILRPFLALCQGIAAPGGGGHRRQLDTTADGGAMAAGGGMKMPVTTPPMNPNSI